MKRWIRERIDQANGRPQLPPPLPPGRAIRLHGGSVRLIHAGNLFDHTERERQFIGELIQLCDAFEKEVGLLMPAVEGE